MRLNSSLDAILSSTNKIRILRAFFSHPNLETSERQLERLAKIPQASIHYNIKDLANENLIKIKRFGKTNVLSLNLEHPLANQLNSLFSKEKNLTTELAQFLKKNLQENLNILVAVLFGSITKGVSRPDSDIDLFLISKNKEETVLDLQEKVWKKYGNSLSIFAVTTKELSELKKKAIYSELKKGSVLLEKIKW